MKGKEEDEERNENICPQRTDTQSNKQRTENSNTEATLILCGSSGERANKLGARTLGARSRGSKNVTYRQQTTDKKVNAEPL